jgi:hypothetical protein
MNKNQTAIDSGDDDGNHVDVHTNAIATDIGHNITIFIRETLRQSAFFTQYERHSEQLSNAFRQYLNLLNFANCEYVDGVFFKYHEKFIEPAVPYMDYMKKHLDIAYKTHFIDPTVIQSERNTICKEMNYMVTTPFTCVPHGPTFETIITNRINDNCPGLDPTENTDPDPDTINFYLCRTTFQIVFEVVNNKRQLNLKVKQTFLNDVHELIHGSGTTVARGDEQTVLKLKSVLEELISNERILGIINQYHKLKDRLDNDNNIEYLRDF